MWFVLIGVLLLGLKLAGLGPVAAWSWWIVLAPFGLAALWWAFADSMGITRGMAMRRQDEKVRRRREQQAENLGLRPPGGKRGKR